jgi:hypothetical protein
MVPQMFRGEPAGSPPSKLLDCPKFRKKFKKAMIAQMTITQIASLIPTLLDFFAAGAAGFVVAIIFVLFLSY